MSAYKNSSKKKHNPITSQSVLLEKTRLLNFENFKLKNNNQKNDQIPKPKKIRKITPTPISLRLKPNNKDKNSSFITTISYRLSPNQNNIKPKKQKQRSISEKDNRKTSISESISKRNTSNKNDINNNHSISLNESSIINSNTIMSNHKNYNKYSPNKIHFQNHLQKKNAIQIHSNPLSSSNSPSLSLNTKSKQKITINKKTFSPFCSDGINNKTKKVKPLTHHQKNHSNNLFYDNLKINSFHSKNIFQNFKSKKLINIVQSSSKNFSKSISTNTSKNISTSNTINLSNNHIHKEKKINQKITNKKNIKSINSNNSNIKKIEKEDEKEKTCFQKILMNGTYTSFSLLNIKESKNYIIKNIKCMHDISKTGISGEDKKVNQDNYFIFKNFGNSFSNIYMGICDGHGYYGHEVSGYIRENLPMDLNHLIKNKNLNVQNDNLTEVITETLIKENENLLKNPNIDTNLSGTTCVSLIYTPKKLIIANIGDSRVILGKQLKNNIWESEILSRDHKPNIPEESERIKEKGGRIRPMKDEYGNFIGPLRVYMKDKDMPGLAMTRSFGDYYATLAGTVCIPEVKERFFCQEDKFIVIGSDGLFEFISNDEIVNFVKDFYYKEDIVGCCEFLYQEARKRWIKEEEDTVDDITIIVVFFE